MNQKDPIQQALEDQLKAAQEQGNTEELESIANDAESGFYEDVAEQAREAIAQLESQGQEIEQQVEEKLPQVEEMGGAAEELHERVEPVQEEMREVVEGAEEEIKEVEEEIVEVEKNEDSQGQAQEINLDASKVIEKQEKIKELETEISGLLDQISSSLPNQLSELYNSESYKKLLDLNEKSRAEEKSLWESYDRYTQGGDGSHRRTIFTMGPYGNPDDYIDDLKFHSAPKDLIKRFEEYKEKFKMPENNAYDDFENKRNKTINKDRWDFEKTLEDKSREVFGKELREAEDFRNKFYDQYRITFNKAYEDTIPDKKLHINTMGTIYS